ncbi:MAG: DNA-3-methyladenine glycosylase family protein [Chloroflexota bacterium]
MTVLEIVSPSPYDFLGCIKGHGWISLEPFHPTETGFRRVERLDSGRVVLLHIREDDSGESSRLRIEVDAGLSPSEQREVLAKSRYMLRLDEDLSEFYGLCLRAGGQRGLCLGRGRLLRSPSLFEDAFKVIATTNVTWRQTKAMIARTVALIGPAVPGAPSLRAFPGPAEVLAAGADFFRNEARLGYRTEAILALAERADELEALRSAALSPAELRKRLLTFKGIGPYASATLAMLAGCYDFLPVDSGALAFTAKKYFGGRAPAPSEVEAMYEPWGRWKYLGYWTDTDVVEDSPTQNRPTD